MELDGELLKRANALAEVKGVTLDSVMEVALREYVEIFSEGPLDEEFMRSYREIVSRFDTVFERLAKS